MRIFFFGDQPTHFDCIVFGFLQTQSLKDVCKSHVSGFLLSHKNLVEFCNRILENWYVPEGGSGKDHKLDYRPLADWTTKKTKKEQSQGSSQEWQSGLIVLAGLAAIFVYTAFIPTSGRF